MLDERDTLFVSHSSTLVTMASMAGKLQPTVSSAVSKFCSADVRELLLFSSLGGRGGEREGDGGAGVWVNTFRVGTATVWTYLEEKMWYVHPCMYCMYI